jgi:hypothetical protein
MSEDEFRVFKDILAALKKIESRLAEINTTLQEMTGEGNEE